MNWTTLAPIILSVATTLGASEGLKLFLTRGSRRTSDKKVKTETEAIVSGQLLGWTTQAEARATRAEARADRAEQRAEETETRFQGRIDEMFAELDGMRTEVQRLRVLIRDCTAAPRCPVRIAMDTAGRQ